MFTLSCPRCRKNSYSSDEEFFHACPYCGFKFSGRYGSDRRLKERIKQEIPFGFYCKEQLFEASTIDSSEKGLAIRIFGDPSVAVGDTIDLPIGDIQIRAKIMWVNKVSDKSMIGLQRLN